jgi:hypothetical protein
MGCKEKKKSLDAAATDSNNGAANPVKFKYTFNGWDSASLPLTGYGAASDEFPAFLTWGELELTKAWLT